MEIVKRDLIDLVKNKEEIREKELPDGSYTYCYMVAFPDTFDTWLSKECRGLIISKDGRVLRRPFHKFFNVNEKEETQLSVLDNKEIHSVREKVDGSMIAPWIDTNGDIHFDTKKLNLDMRERIEKIIPKNIWDFSVYELQMGVQPIFELYHPDIPETNIVVDYGKPIWKLLALRNLFDGEYYNDDIVDNCAKEYGLERPISYDMCNLTTSEIANFFGDKENMEGVIIRYTDGTFAKVKGEWYLRRHKVLSLLKYEHHIAKLIINEDSIDDIAPLLSDEQRRKIEEVGQKIKDNIVMISDFVIKIAGSFKSKKELGLSKYAKNPFSNIMFRLVNSDLLSDRHIVFNLVKDNLNSKWVNKSTSYEEWEKIVQDITRDCKR